MLPYISRHALVKPVNQLKYICMWKISTLVFYAEEKKHTLRLPEKRALQALIDTLLQIGIRLSWKKQIFSINIYTNI